MPKRHKAIQFQHIARDSDSAGLLIEQLRYAGLVNVVSEKEIEDGRVAYLLKIQAPHDLNESVWIDHNVNRMKSFGINAVEVFV